MILRYGGSNFYCFKEDFEIDLRLNKNCPEEISGGSDCSAVMCIKGANAAGKTNALKALSFISDFISVSFDRKPSEKINVETYFNNSKPTLLYCEFRINEIDYRYDLTLQQNRVMEEKLSLITDPDNHLFLRIKTIVSTENELYLPLVNIPQLRSNASLISIAHQHEIECISALHSLFYNLNSNVGYMGHNEFWSNDKISKLYYDNPDILKFAKEQLQKFDTGIVNLEIDFNESVEGEIVYFPLFSFEVDGEIKKLRMSVQSSGTIRLYRLLALFAVVTFHYDHQELSSILILDELDLHLHSFIVPELIRLFENNSNTQLIFTCQNDQVLDLMGKYRATLINKDDNESYSYRLDELPSDLLRNNRPITPHYKKGSIGGVPNIGE